MDESRNNNLMEKLLIVQAELKVPKNNFNKFGNYKYRACEDILEAVKPILAKHRCTITLTDVVVNIGDRNYVKAIARFCCIDYDLTLHTEAYARESETQKGMTEAQITGSASSYARKYALNGLLLIDDTKDDDTMDVGSGKLDKKPVPKTDVFMPKEKATKFMDDLPSDIKAIIELKAITTRKLYEICNSFCWDKTKIEDHFMSMLENDVPDIQEVL